jgi:6-phosphogluconolactonase
MVNNHSFAHSDELLSALCTAIITDLEEAISEKGSAVLLVSGGSTPKPLFKRLRETPIAWENVRIGLCDERWVNPEHADSNEKLVRELLLQEHAINAQFIGLYCTGMSADEAQNECSEKVKSQLWPIDVCVLGMGDDAHTASLFPHNPKLLEGLEDGNKNLCISITPQTAPHPRMSLTFSAIISTRHLYLHFEGEKKRLVFEEALRGSDVEAMPIRAFLQQEIKDIEVYYA